LAGRALTLLPALAAPALFGLGVAACKPLLAGVDPLVMAGGLYLCSGLGLGAWRLFSRGAEAPLGRKDWPWLAGAVVLGGVVGPALLMSGLRLIPANTASLLLNLETVLTVLVAWALFREPVGALGAWGMGLIVLGGAVLSWSGGALGFSWGALAVVGACLAWALDNNLSQRVSGKDPVQTAAVKGVVAGAFNLALGLSLGAPLPAPHAWGRMALIGVLGYGLSLVFFLRSLREIGAARTGTYYALAPFIGAAAGLLFLGEPLSARFSAAALLMGAGVWLTLSQRHEHAHSHRDVHEHVHEHDEHHRHEHPEGAPGGATHAHSHSHEGLTHTHPHEADIHHRDGH